MAIPDNMERGEMSIHSGRARSAVVGAGMQGDEQSEAQWTVYSPVNVIRLQGHVSPHSLADLLKRLVAPVTGSPHHAVRDLVLAALVEVLHGLERGVNE